MDAGRNPWAKAEATREVKTRATASRGRDTRPPTLREAARAVHTSNLPKWTGANTGAAWLRELERHVFPALGDMRVDDLTRHDVLDVLTPIWGQVPETARKLRNRLAMVFRWAMAYCYRTDNPAGEAIEAALPRLAKVRAHRKALPYAEVPGFLADLRQTRRAYPQPDQAGLLALRFLVLTAARSAEVRAARWDEMNMKDGLWTVPAYRMKARKQHRVPLSTQAMDTLIEARDQLGVWGDGLIFPGHGGNQLGMNIFEQRLKANGVDCVPHGFRSSFRDWAAEQTNYTREAIELSLAHNVGNETERAYFRSDLLDQRRGLMQDWADFAAL